MGQDHNFTVRFEDFEKHNEYIEEIMIVKNNLDLFS